DAPGPLLARPLQGCFMTTTETDLHETERRIRRAARADAMLCVLADMHPTPPDTRTLNAWPAGLRAALADRDSFAAYLPPVVHLELCDSPGRDLLTGYLLAADRRRA